ncbi:hypothetical protein GCM10010394_35060 [Streptomyces crystallinus]|uniref:Uncharacterized protein n=1 Tax=Streptomyces crystallinus TaxID=68191 RepID=A0ABP3R2P2_9ACTN
MSAATRDRLEQVADGRLDAARADEQRPAVLLGVLSGGGGIRRADFPRTPLRG